ncbi:30S ribosomal protein S11 [Rickettsiales endosymbiont of Paramecium tredecaurelia]|uniref:30S ribosomal protein S11 n=1 Tax=Candidatus Sarmatiella mevalonica TaxID=2770581 RepID=UPI001923FB5A|nr:30S ribosomal protein S11 [Candidatus Sarmatiella mevalonica]MBL3284792.1 30S ribosomal protein S11 [Candidatus Sarmatiella mevalonica]
MSKKNVVLKKEKKNIGLAIAHIYATFNNTIITITDVQGNTIASSSAGANRFKGAKKSTPHAAQVTANRAADEAAAHGVKTLAAIVLKGPGAQRESGVRALFSRFVVTRIEDNTAIPFNGTKRPKRRRI